MDFYSLWLIQMENHNMHMKSFCIVEGSQDVAIEMEDAQQTKISFRREYTPELRAIITDFCEAGFEEWKASCK